jgi:divalent metal cation (Fe/Co/Zn/Cd) transporter
MNAASLAGALLGAKVSWQIDPSLAIVLAVYIVFAWGRQGLRQVQSLVGVAAPPETLQPLTYLTLKHRPDAVLEVDTVRAYTVGDNLVAEVDIVLPRSMPLQEAHDVGEELQVKLEALPGVARAFVHLDVESKHAPEHND